MKPCLGVAAFALIACTPICYAASFDCTKATSKIEEIICRYNHLSQLDEVLTRAYQERLRELKETKYLREQQRTWLSEVRNRCMDAACLVKVYQKRLAQLSVAPTFPSDVCAVPDGGTLGEGYCLGSKVEVRGGPTNLNTPLSGFPVSLGHDMPRQCGEPHEQTQSS